MPYLSDTTRLLETKSLTELISLWEIAGYCFEASAELPPLVGKGFHYTTFTTGDRPCVLYSREVSYNGDGFNAFVYRNAVVSGGTVIDSIRQASDISTNVSNVTITTGIETITDIGIETRSARYVFGNTSNQGNGDSLEVIDSPQLILPNTTILLVFQNRDSSVQTIASHLRWAEPKTIPGLIIQNNQFIAYTGMV